VSSKREKELSRLRAERQTARLRAEAARERRRRSLIASVVAVVVAVLAAVVAITALGDDEPGGSVAGPCVYAPGVPAAKPVQRPSAVPGPAATSATITTDRGTIGLALLPDAAPCTVNSFASLARQGFYDNTPCHRLTTGGIYILQCGDPTGTGTGGPGYQFAEENLTGATYPRGTVAMAKGKAAASTTSQFFLVYRDSALPPQYTPFATITSGLDVLDTIAAGGAGPADPASGLTAPLLPTTIVTLRTSTGTPAPAATTPPAGS
jgi:peptidyl-prolyl cis-trans isomerase B (cyclophilin B)